jgi:hypothetical protein
MAAPMPSGPMVDLGSYPMVATSKFTPSQRSSIDFIVIHTMEAPQTPGRARQVAEWFAGPNAPEASAHFEVDDREVIRSVHDKDWAWHAGPANPKSIGIEHAGYADKTDWNSDYSKSELENSAKLAALYCDKYNIPVVWLSPQDLKAGRRGITGHVECNAAFEGGRGHFDPGATFPREQYIKLVQSFTASAVMQKRTLTVALAGVGLLVAAYYVLTRKKG